MAADGGVVEVVPAREIAARVSELGEILSRDYADRNPLLVAVLVGSLPFLSDLVRAMSIPLEVDFLGLSRFGEGGRIRIALDTAESVAGRHVVIVEDIIDTGLTLTVLRKMLEDKGAASVATATLVDKTRRRLVEVPLEYRGFEVGDEYLVGYGLDWKGRYRNLDSLWAVLDLESLVADPDALVEVLYDSVDR
ncbi:MAG TPA: hypoxanthine phosphoribosyltransferase [Acidimicrobiia bacterium]|nr:hypoxanthine phosphoribosyltransferase [Acidimicrobiia bacterium]